MNQPIFESLEDDNSKHLMMEECVENELDYILPCSDKPYKTYKHLINWTQRMMCQTIGKQK